MDLTTGPAAFAIVHDVAASWHDYAAVRDIVGCGAPGLIMHVAGPTDGGFRTIDIWDSETLWRAQQRRLDEALAALAVPPVARHFRVRHLVALIGDTDRLVISTQETQP